jgi:NADPH:quinone reductase
VQRRRFVGELDQIARPRMRLCLVEQIDERHRCQHSGAALGTRGNGRFVEPGGKGEQCVGLARIELDLLPFLVDESQRSDHEVEGTSCRSLGRDATERTMKAATITDGRIEVVERPDPEPSDDLVVVRVHGAGVNRADLLQLAGNYPAPPGSPPDIPGLEFAGVVEAMGPQATGVDIGDRVFGIAGGGAQAELVAIPAAQCARVPDGLDLVAVGGAPEAFVTAHDALVTKAHLRRGEWVLVHAVGSGVGTTTLQLATALGARVIGTARTQTKLDRCEALGLVRGIVPTVTDGQLDVDALAWSIVEATDGGADVTLDLVGGDYMAANVNAAALMGRIVCIGTVAGARATLPLVAILAKRLTIAGTVLRARNTAEKAAATAGFVRDVVPLLASARVFPIIERTFPLEQVTDAYELLASNATFGKVVLDCR